LVGACLFEAALFGENDNPGVSDAHTAILQLEHRLQLLDCSMHVAVSIENQNVEPVLE
jgi:hypothetical protein